MHACVETFPIEVARATLPDGTLDLERNILQS